MRSHRKNRGTTLFESLVTLLLLFVILSSVVALLQSSLTALKSQKGRAMAELTFVQEMIRRDLADALTVKGGDAELVLTRHDYTVSWQELLEMKASPTTLPPITVSYQLNEDSFTRFSPTAAQGERLLTLQQFTSEVRESDVRVALGMTLGKRQRNLVWSFRCAAL